MEITDMSPQKSSPKMPRIQFSVPAGMVQQVKRLGDAIGMGDAGMHRLCWILGAMQVLQLRNTMSVGQKLEGQLMELKAIAEAMSSTEGDEDESE